MSYYEMKLMTCALSRILLENEVRGINTKKSITNLIGKLNMMLTKQGFKNAWTYKWYGFFLGLFSSNNNLHNVEYKMNKETKEGIGFMLVLGLGWSSIILLNWLIN